MLTPKQCRAARIFLDWTQKDLEEATRAQGKDKIGKGRDDYVSAVTIGEFERGQTDPKVSTLLKLQRALERAGIIFIEPTTEHGPGVMLREGRKI
jgi:transcriptional regulator with XRE-family HTH domain